MRYHEIASGLRLAVSCEEQELIDKTDGAPIDKGDLDEREQELARLMVSRGVLDQYPHDGRVFYHLSSANDIWRGHPNGSK
jgi:hypothetical protein